MSSISASNKRIAKNTLALYFRTGITLLVSLYTSRVVLNALGVDDFGIYNVVGGVVVLLSFLNAALSGATQRFLNFELGRGDVERTAKVFKASFIVHLGLALLVFLLAETVGLWFLNAKLNIPEGRMDAANWIYQFSILASMLSIIMVPYRATIIAYEKMGFYAYLSIFEALLKLLVAYIIMSADTDRLKLYSVLIFAVGALSFAAHFAYCRINFETAKAGRVKNGELFRELLGFSGWTLFGTMAWVANTQGINIIFNFFIGVVANAAMGIANQVLTAVHSMLSGFQVAFNPQIVKNYAANDSKALHRLVYRASKISFYLVFVLVYPLCLNVNEVLFLWLGKVPAYAAGFVCANMLSLLLESLGAPLYMMINSTGKIRQYNFVAGMALLLNLPLAFGLLFLGVDPVLVLGVRALIYLFMTPVRVYFAKKQAGLPVFGYMKEVVCRICVMALVVIPLPLILKICLPGYWGFFASISASCLVSLAALGIVLSKQERETLFAHLLGRFKFSRRA